MKLALMTDDGNVTTYGNVGMGTVSFERDEMTLEFDVRRQSNGDFGQTHLANEANDAAIDFFDLKAIKKGRRIPKSAIRKGDLIRMKDHSEPVPGERDYKTLEYVATEDGDGSYRHNPGEKFYLLERPKPELPTAPGSVVKARLKINPEQALRILTLGKDRVWAGPHGRASVETFNRIYELVEVMH